jgi:hypothetical protein
MNAIAIAKEVAAACGVDIEHNDLEYYIWECTGWPSFFDGDPETTFRAQLKTAFDAVREAQAKQAILDVTPTIWDRLLDTSDD